VGGESYTNKQFKLPKGSQNGNHT